MTKQLRRNTFQTAPTTSTAASLNPANVSFDKGLGLEAMAQTNNPLSYSLISGTGKMGGALISGSRDNSFFGNRTPELDEEFIFRQQNNIQFKDEKLSFVAGAKLYSSKKMGLDVGAILKRHSDVKSINPGFGISGRLWMIHFGASFFRDDAFIDFTKTIDPQTGLPYSMTYGKKNYSENFGVMTYTVGTRIRNFAFDVGSIKSTLDFYNGEQTDISIYSASYQYNDFLFNLAHRKETSLAKIYNDETKLLESGKDKSDFISEFNIH